MKLAVECRADMLELVQPFADLDFVLTHEFLGNPEYREYYTQSTRFKILDNSVNETGKPTSIEELGDCAEFLKPDVIIAPDYPGDVQSTIAAYVKAVETFEPQGIAVMGVLQGNSYEELKNCVSLYRGAIAVPYDILSEKTEDPEIMALRRALVVNSLCRERVVHLLGFTSIKEFDWYGMTPEVKSIDTGAPILLGLLEKDILDPLESKEKPTYNQMLDIELTQKRWALICRNIALFRKYIS